MHSKPAFRFCCELRQTDYNDRALISVTMYILEQGRMARTCFCHKIPPNPLDVHDKVEFVVPAGYTVQSQSLEKCFVAALKTILALLMNMERT